MWLSSFTFTSNHNVLKELFFPFSLSKIQKKKKKNGEEEKGERKVESTGTSLSPITESISSAFGRGALVTQTQGILAFLKEERNSTTPATGWMWPATAFCERSSRNLQHKITTNRNEKKKKKEG
jgi:hypothetical protein